MSAIEILRNEHGVILEALGLLERHIRRVSAGAPLDADFARWVLLFTREFADDTHHAKEEGVLFDLLERRGLARAAPLVAAMRADHESCRSLAGAMERALGRGDAVAFIAAGRRLAELLRGHISRENETLFVPAEALLTPADDAAALEAFGRVVHERDGVLIRQRHLAAIERWRAVLGG